MAKQLYELRMILQTCPKCWKSSDVKDLLDYIEMLEIGQGYIEWYTDYNDFPRPGRENVIYVNTGNYEFYIWDDSLNDYISIDTEQVQVEDSLTSDDPTVALSANQGRILNEKFNNYSTTDQINTVLDTYLPLTAGPNKKLSGPLYLNNIVFGGTSSNIGMQYQLVGQYLEYTGSHRFITSELMINNATPYNTLISSLGASTDPFGYIYSRYNYANVVIPYIYSGGTDVRSIGTSSSRWARGYIDVLQSDSMIPTISAGSSIGVTDNRYQEAYINTIVFGSTNTAGVQNGGSIGAYSSANRPYQILVSNNIGTYSTIRFYVNNQISSFTGNLSFSFSGDCFYIDKSFSPFSHNTIDLGGNAGNYWRNVYATTINTTQVITEQLFYRAGGSLTSIHVLSNLIPYPSAGTLSLGNTDYYWNNVYSTNVTTSSLGALNGTGSVIALRNVIEPLTSNSVRLGGSSRYFSEIYSSYMVSGVISPLAGDTVLFSGDYFNPLNSSGSSLGDSSNRWENLYASNTYINTIYGINDLSVNFGGSIKATRSNAWDIGGVGGHFKNLYIGNIFVYGTNGISIEESGSLISNKIMIKRSDSESTIGIQTNPFNFAYFNSLYTIDIIALNSSYITLQSNMRAGTNGVTLGQSTMPFANVFTSVLNATSSGISIVANGSIRCQSLIPVSVPGSASIGSELGSFGSAYLTTLNTTSTVSHRPTVLSSFSANIDLAGYSNIITGINGSQSSWNITSITNGTEGAVYNIVIQNNYTSDFVINLPSGAGYVSNETQVTIPPSSTAEISVLYVLGTYIIKV